MMRNLLLIVAILIMCPYYLLAQDAVGINNDNPDASAILDVASTTQGVLVPRMTDVQRNSIVSPAQGLLVYSTTTNTFWFFNNSIWVELASSTSNSEIADADNDTKVQVEETANDNIIRFDMRGTEFFRMDNGRLEVVNTGNSVFMGQNAGAADDLTNNRNVFVGTNSGRNNESGIRNVAVGYRSFNNNLSGSDNVALGEDALRRNESGSFNLAIGSNSLDVATASDSNMAIGFNSLTNLNSGNSNVAVGHTTMSSKTSGGSNVAIGNAALQNNTTGSNNVAVGRQAGGNNNGSGNVFLGYQAGRNETGSNKLYIDNSNTTNPLIWGDFSTDSVVVNGNHHVTGNITFVGTITDLSDRRAKENFDTLTQVMHLIEQLNAYSYRMKGDKSGEREYGFIAQEVAKVFPEMVQMVDQKKGYYGVNYLEFIAVLIQGLKEQQEMIDDYSKYLEDSDQELDELKAEVESIKQLIHDQ